MNHNSRVYIAGHTGLLGSAIFRALYEAGYRDIITATHKDLDLTDQNGVFRWFDCRRPEYIFLAAAKVGNIAENIKHPVEFLNENILIQKNVLAAAHQFGTKKLLFFSSNCCYPRNCPQPMKEKYLMSGPLEPTNEAYALAKIIGMKLCQSYNSQYQTRFNCAVLASLYGPNDCFGTSRTHVIADMMQKLCKAKKDNLKEITFWGDGSPLREYMFVDDAANAAIFLMKKGAFAKNNKAGAFINAGTGEEIYVLTLARLIADIVGYSGKISWDISKPNGMPRKLLDSKRINLLGWRHQTVLRDGIARTYKWYLENFKV